MLSEEYIWVTVHNVRPCVSSTVRYW